MGDVEFKGVGGGELRWVSLAGFTELGEAGMDRAGVGCWDQKCFQRRLLGKEATSAIRQK